MKLAIHAISAIVAFIISNLGFAFLRVPLDSLNPTSADFMFFALMWMAVTLSMIIFPLSYGVLYLLSLVCLVDRTGALKVRSMAAAGLLCGGSAILFVIVVTGRPFHEPQYQSILVLLGCVSGAIGWWIGAMTNNVMISAWQKMPSLQRSH